MTTYLVTNRVDWYQRIRDCCGWSYDANWVDKPIDHAALELSWRPDGTQITKDSLQRASEQNMKLWADWYTILNAHIVYHSPLDFSRSAIQWNSQIITAFELHDTVPKRRKQQARLCRSSSSIAAATATLAPLHLRSTYKYSQCIRPLVEHLNPNSFRPNNIFVYKRFCQKYRIPNTTVETNTSKKLHA